MGFGVWSRYVGPQGPFRLVNARYLGIASRVLVVRPLLLAIPSALILVLPQMQEVFAGILEARDLWHGACGLVALCLLSTFLYGWQHALVTRLIDGVYPDHANLDFDKTLLSFRRDQCLLVAGIPWLGYCTGLALTFQRVWGQHLHYRSITDAFPGSLPASQALKSSFDAVLPLFGSAWMLSAITLGLLLLVLITYNPSARSRNYFTVAYFVGGSLIIANPILLPSVTIPLARGLGPFACAILVMIAGPVALRIGYSAVRLILLLLLFASNMFFSVFLFMHSGWKTSFVTRLPVFAVGIGVVYLVYSNVIAVPPEARESSDPHSSFALSTGQAAHRGLDPILKDSFAHWLKARRSGNAPFPVFIVTAQGGGIYAASAASSLLATLQDLCPSFARHIFAISAVSGGSVGASVFNAALAEENASKGETGCAPKREELLSPRMNQSSRRSPFARHRVSASRFSPRSRRFRRSLCRKGNSRRTPLDRQGKGAGEQLRSQF